MAFFSVKDKYGKTKLPLLKSRLFWAGLALKVLLSFLFASIFLKDLFAPFVNFYVTNGFDNPYDYFIEYGKGNEFPYPPLMLWILSIPRILFAPFIQAGSSFGFLESFIYRIPLLVADLAILFVLIRWLKTKMRQVLVWYWLSPVLIYINYFHGQLDVIPISFLFASLYLLFKQKWYWSVLFLSLSITCKTNIVLVLPFFAIYVFRTQQINIKQAAIALVLFSLVIVSVNFPFLFSAGFVKMVYNNPVQQQVFDLFYQFNKTLKIYFIPAIYFSLMIWYINLRFVNRDQLILFLTFTFLALTLMVAPMQGWYYWIIPFLIYFGVKQSKEERYLLALLSALYFLYFSIIPISDYFNSSLIQGLNSGFNLYGIFGPRALDISFTILQTTLVILSYHVFKKGIQDNIQTKFLSQPYLIAIGGDSAAGKSTLSNSLSLLFEKQNTTIVRGDDMHKWERGNENWNVYTHLDPRANKLHEDLHQVKSLKTGMGVKRSFYDHTTGKFTLPQFIKSNKLIVFEGLHSFYLNNHSDVYDLKIFMVPDEELRVWWKVKRDVAKRGYSPEQVVEQLKKREEDSLKYIRSQSDKADMLVSFFSFTKLDPVRLDVSPDLGLRISLANNENIEPLVEKLNKCKTLSVEINYAETRLIITLKGEISSEMLDLLASQLIPEMEDVGIYNSEWKNDYEGILQLITLYIVFSRIKSV